VGVPVIQVGFGSKASVILCATVRRGVLAATVLLLTQTTLLAQKHDAKNEANTDSAPVMANYGSSVAYPDAVVEIPFYLTASIAVGSLESNLHFEKGLLELTKVRPTDILDSAGKFATDGEITEDPKDATKAVFHLKINAAAGERKPLPSGLLAFVTFKISGTAKAGDVHLASDVIVRDTALAPKVIPGAAAETLLLSIYPKGIDPMLNCFMFSH
jgi:hypothetical protein